MTLTRRAPLRSKQTPEEIRAKRQAAAERWQQRRQERARVRVEAGEHVGLAQISDRRMEREGEELARNGSTLKPGGPIVASSAQRAKTRAAGVCRVLSFLEDVEAEAWPADVRSALMSWNGPMTIDSAHLACAHACEKPDATINLVRPLHVAYDLRRLNLLAYVTREEEAHAAFEAGILGAIQRITGMDWEPVDGTPATQDRLPLLSFDEQAEHARRLGLEGALCSLTGVSWQARPRVVIAR